MHEVSTLEVYFIFQIKMKYHTNLFLFVGL